MIRLLIVHSKTPFEKTKQGICCSGYLVLRYGCYLIPGDICLIRDTAMATYGGNTVPGSKRWMLLVAFVLGDLVQFITTNRAITNILYRLSLTKSNLFHDIKSLVMSPERQRQGIGTICKLLIGAVTRLNLTKWLQ